MISFDFFHLFDDPDTKFISFYFLIQPFLFYITIPVSCPFSPQTHPTFPHLPNLYEGLPTFSTECCPSFSFSSTWHAAVPIAAYHSQCEWHCTPYCLRLYLVTVHSVTHLTWLFSLRSSIYSSCHCFLLSHCCLVLGIKFKSTST